MLFNALKILLDESTLTLCINLMFNIQIFYVFFFMFNNVLKFSTSNNRNDHLQNLVSKELFLLIILYHNL